MVEINNIDPPKWEQRAAEYRAKKAAEELANKAKTNGHSVSVTNGAVTSEDEVVGLEEVPLQRWEDTPKGASLIEATSKAHFTCEMAYNMYTKNSWPKRTSGSEEVSVLCPAPQHNEKNPSCSVNVAKNTWFCNSTKCGRSGDAITIAALNLGYDLNNYKDSLPTIREDIAKKMGWREGQRTIGNPKPPWIPPQPAEQSSTNGHTVTLDPAIPVTQITTAPSYVDLSEDSGLDPDQNFDYPEIDWRAAAKPGTFLYEWCAEQTKLPVAEGYHFWNGLLAIGAALGRSTYLVDEPFVYGNLYVCIVGPTGGGKTQATVHLIELIEDTLEFDPDNPFTHGVKMIYSPASGEHLVKEFGREIFDPTDPKRSLGNFPVKGLIDFKEMSDLMNKVNRAGSNIDAALIDFYDNRKSVTQGAIGSGNKIAVEPFLVSVATTQLKLIKSLMTKKDAASGFLNRWIFAMGKYKYRPLWGKSKPDSAVYKPLFESLIGWSQNHPEVSVVPGSDAEIESIRFWDETAFKFKNDDTTDMFTRLDLDYKKFILLLAANAHETEVSLDTILRVETMFPYLVESYKAVGVRIGSSEEIDRQKKIILALQRFEAREGKPPTPAELRRNLPDDISLQDLNRTLKTLVELEMLTAIAPPPGLRGRPTTRYSYAG